MLNGLRVLDLTDERGLAAGRMLADLGADVVQIEPVKGSSARAVDPKPSDDMSSFVWQTFAAGKRGIAFDPRIGRDRNKLYSLVERADVLITSWDRDDVAFWGLEPTDIMSKFPTLVYTSITSFGWDGPASQISATDLTVWAAGGPLAPHRDGQKPPVRISVEQAYLHAAADAVTGTLLALLERRSSGRGQFVDISAQVSVSQATLSRVLAGAVGDDNPEWQRQPTVGADQSGSGAATSNAFKKWKCRDGLIEFHMSMGAAAGSFTNRFFQWMWEEDHVNERIGSWDWRQVPKLASNGSFTGQDLDDARSAVREFLLTKSKAEVLEESLRRRLLSMPIYDIADVAVSAHLDQRRFYTKIDIAGLEVAVPSAFAHVSGLPTPQVRLPAPDINEHSNEICREWLEVPVSANRGTVAQREQPLTGLKVLDLSWVVAGPMIGRTLADFGADVIRVESSSRVETARMMQPFHNGEPNPEGSALFGNCNAGKRGISLNLGSTEGRQLARELADQADVVVESFAPGQLEKWGLDYPSLSSTNPSLIMLSSSIAGQNGPWSRLAGFGNVGSSLSGFQRIVGWPDLPPLGPFGPYTDYLGPRTALAALLSALWARDRERKGCYIDVSQVESGVYFLAPQIAHYGYDGTIVNARGNSDPTFVPHGVYPVQSDEYGEQFIALAIRDAEDWHKLTKLIDNAELKDSDLLRAERRRESREFIDERISGWTSCLVGKKAVSLLQGAGIPAYLALRPEDYMHDAQIKHRNHLVRLSHPLYGETVVEGARVQLSATPGMPRRSAPTLGQHTREIITSELGYNDSEFELFASKGAFD